MRRPHVYERSAPRSPRQPYDEPPDLPRVARTIAGSLTNLIDKAAGAGLTTLADLLEAAWLEAESIVYPAPADDGADPTGPANDAIARMDADIAEDKAKR